MNYNRLAKVIFETAYCSHKEAKELIAAGCVFVNGKKAGKELRVTQKDEISINGKVLIEKVKDIYLVFNKPVGIECITDTNVDGNIISYINYPEYIFPVGRLDKQSEGLILLTNDGSIVNEIIGSENKHEKEYIVKVDQNITPDFIDKMANGIPILNTITKKCSVSKIDDFTFSIILNQGLNRQIRRMCKYCNYKVTSLKRIRIMNISIGDLPIGEYRELSKGELEGLFVLLS